MVNQTLYLEVLKRNLKRFIEANRESISNVVFWPDKASVHCARSVTEWLESEKVCFVPKTTNLPKTPQVRPIETLWAIRKAKVYENHWSARKQG